MSNKGKLFVLSAPGGTGKTTLAKKLIRSMPNITQSISVTTREKRKGEIQGKDYIFVNKKEFTRRKKNKEFLENTQVFAHQYGTEKKAVFSALNQGLHVILVIDVVGAKKIKRQIKEAVLIFISPPSLAELKRRLLDRKTDTIGSIQSRLTQAKEEMKEIPHYDYHMVNDDLNTASETLKAIVIAEEHKVNN